MARPSSYTEDLGMAICRRLANGESLRRICEDEGMPDRGTVFDWAARNEAFRHQYAFSREMQAHCYADNAAEMCAGRGITDPKMARVQLDAIKWTAGRLAPKSYGDKLDLNHGGQADGKPVEVVHRVIVDLGD